MPFDDYKLIRVKAGKRQQKFKLNYAQEEIRWDTRKNKSRFYQRIRILGGHYTWMVGGGEWWWL